MHSEWEAPFALLAAVVLIGGAALLASRYLF